MVTTRDSSLSHRSCPSGFPVGSALRGVPAPWARPASRLLQQPRGLPAAPLSLTFSSAAARGTLPAGSCRFLFGWPSIRHRVKTETLTQGPMAKPGGRPASPLSSAGPGRLCPARPAAQRAGWTALPAECALTRALFPEVSALRTPSPLKSLLKCHVPAKRPQPRLQTADHSPRCAAPAAPLRTASPLMMSMESTPLMTWSLRRTLPLTESASRTADFVRLIR